MYFLTLRNAHIRMCWYLLRELFLTVCVIICYLRFMVSRVKMICSRFTAE